MLLDSRDYFASKGQEVLGLEVDGQFRGWDITQICNACFASFFYHSQKSCRSSHASRS